jgi:hypothetical protein
MHEISEPTISPIPSLAARQDRLREVRIKVGTGEDRRKHVHHRDATSVAFSHGESVVERPIRAIGEVDGAKDLLEHGASFSSLPKS